MTGVRLLDGRLAAIVVPLIAAVCLACTIAFNAVAAIVGAGCLVLISLCWQPAGISIRTAGLLMAFLLAGYALLGRTFARLNAGPVYIGEIALAVLLTTALAHGDWGAVWRSWVTRLLVLFALWGAVRTAPFLSTYGLDALRDGAVWGYGAFSVAVAVLLIRHGSLAVVIRTYRKFGALFLPWLVLLVAVRLLRWGGAVTQELLPEGSVKPGDVSVHLAGIACFVGLGLHRRASSAHARGWLTEWLIWGGWAVSFFFFGTQNRGGLLSILVALWLALGLWRRGAWAKALYIGLAVMIPLAIFEPDLGTRRKVSPQQVVANLLSVAGDPNPSFEGTRQWRLSWWRKIRDYTLEGEYFWTGKGFGVNLADEDGFQTDPLNHSLRSPHNGHLTILARMGVPGLTLWVLLQGAFGIGLVREFLRARRCSANGRAAVILWILAYWSAFLVNAAFDVYLEGPQGGIWFWTVLGIGLAILVERRSAGNIAFAGARNF